MRTRFPTSHRPPAFLALVVVVTFAFTAAPTPSMSQERLVGSSGQTFPLPPEYPTGDLAESTLADLDLVIDALNTHRFDTDAIARLGQSRDARILWFLVDLMRFAGAREMKALLEAFEEISGTDLPRHDLNAMPDRLIAWDIPAPPGYRELKGALLTLIEPRWEPFFADAESAIDWRLVAWGGVLMDDRIDASPGQSCFRCIPALDDPSVTDAAGGSWYRDELPVFGVVINGAARAYPKNIMEVHEMVNDTVGGRRIGMPYCTLCGSAQAYYTGDLAGFRPVLRTSGLLSRSNKLMYDISTFSAIDTFSGHALSGPLHDAGIVLTQLTVVTSTWAAWREAHPDTTIVARDGGVSGRVYPLDPLRGRDDNGPIFPVGDVDSRLAVQERVLGVDAPDGHPLAFPVAHAVLALQAGESVELAGVRIALDGSGLRAFIGNREAASHEAFWFAWSQFRPETLIWQRGSAGQD